MGKRKNKDPGNPGRAQPQQSFQDLVAGATLAKFSGYIDNQIVAAAQALRMDQQRSVVELITRLVVVEEIVCEKLGFTKSDLAARVAEVQDRFEGFESVDGPVKTGDRVRIEIKTRTVDQAEFQDPARIQIEAVGSGRTLGGEIETAIVGMTKGETKELTVGKDANMVVNLIIDRVSRVKDESQPQVEGNQSVDQA